MRAARHTEGKSSGWFHGEGSRETTAPGQAPEGSRQRGTRVRRWAALAATTGLASWGALFGAVPATGQDHPDHCPDNLLQNAGFEAGFLAPGRAEEVVAVGWGAWYEVLPGVAGIHHAPRYTPRRRDRDGPLAVLTGLWSQEMSTEGGSHLGGLYQTVEVPRHSQVLAGVFVRSEAASPAGGGQGMYAVSLGVDPLGGDNGTRDRIVWSAPLTVTGEWRPLTLDVAVEGPAISFFTRGHGLLPVARNASWWDAACLRLLGPAGEPTESPTPTPRPSATLAPGEATYTPDLAALQATALAMAEEVQASAMAATAEVDRSSRATVDLSSPTPRPVPTPAPPTLRDLAADNVGLIFLGLAAFALGSLAVAGWTGARRQAE